MARPHAASIVFGAGRKVAIGLVLAFISLSSLYAQVPKVPFWAGTDPQKHENAGSCQPSTGSPNYTCIYPDAVAACAAVRSWSAPTNYTASTPPQYECRGTPPPPEAPYYPTGLAGYAILQSTCPTNSTASLSGCQCNAGYSRGTDGQSCVVTPAADAGNMGSTPMCRGNPINPAIGNKFQIETDYEPAGPFAVHIRRTYNSTAVRPGSFGARWRAAFDRSIVRIQTSSVNSAAAYRPDGKIWYFDLVGGAYVPRADTADRLVAVTGGYQYTAADGDQTESYDANGKLLSITNREGLAHSFGYDDHGRVATVTDSFGRQLSIAYDIRDRITTITAPSSATYQYAYDSNNNLLSVTYPDSRQRVYHYNESANTGGTNLPNALTGITDENAIRYAIFKYDSSGRAVSTEHAGGAGLITLTYGTNSTVEVDALGGSRTTTFQSTFGVYRIAGITGDPSPHCGPAAQSVDSNGNVSSRTDWNGNRTDYAYDLARNLETQRIEALTSAGATTGQTRTITTEWQASFRLPKRVAEPLRITTYTYNGDGGASCGVKADNVTPVPGVVCSKTVQATSDANGSQGFSATTSGSPRTWAYTYNANGSVLTVNGPRTDVSDVTTYTYYANDDADAGKRGNVATITNAASQVTQITSYNAHGQPLTLVDPNGLTTTLAYDARQRLTSRTVGSEQTSYEYDWAGQLKKVTLPDNSYVSYTYDDAHRLTAIQDNLGNRVGYTLDAMGNRTQEQVFDPANVLAQKRTREYNSLNRLFKDVGALTTEVTQYAYDDQGNVTSVTNPLGKVTSNQYDALNRLKQVTDPGLGVTQYAYNGLDALTQVTDPRNLSTAYTVDGLGNLTLQSSPDTGNTSSTYDLAGNVLTQTDAKSQVTTYAYDALNRVTLITFHDGSRQAYAYDQGTNGIGRLSSITETNAGNVQTSLIQFGYDLHGRVTSETRTLAGVSYAVGYTYDSAGRMSGITYPSGRTVGYGFDSLGRVNQVNTTKPGETQVVLVQNVQYQPFGGVKSFTLGNGQIYSRTIDQDGRIAAYTLGATNYALTFDAASRITGIGSNTYGYDDLDRLTSAVLASSNFGYSYDGVGNRLTKVTGSSTDTYAYSSTSNRIATLTPATGPQRSFTLDSNGSTTNDGVNTYAYDTRGRMTSATSSAGTASYQVNALGQRVKKSATAGDTLFHYDTRGHLIAETDATGAVKRELFYLGDIPVAVFQ